MPNLEITPRERSALRAAAHPLRPVVLIGDNGLTDAVLKEIDLALSAHGLIKVRVAGEERSAREEMLGSICDTLSCAAVHHLGKMLILYRPTVEQIEASKPQTRALRKKASDPHVPKKQAAAGRTKPKPAPRPAKVEAEPVRRDPFDTDKPTRPSTRVPLKKPGAAPRRAGSALSLRAGGRRTTQRTTATSRKPSKATSR